LKRTGRKRRSEEKPYKKTKRNGVRVKHFGGVKRRGTRTKKPSRRGGKGVAKYTVEWEPL